MASPIGESPKISTELIGNIPESIKRYVIDFVARMEDFWRNHPKESKQVTQTICAFLDAELCKKPSKASPTRPSK